MVEETKLHFRDTELRSYLTRWTTPQVLKAGATFGSEIDIILDVDGWLHPVEVKKGANPGDVACVAKEGISLFAPRRGRGTSRPRPGRILRHRVFASELGEFYRAAADESLFSL
jgi:hypothetical protein